MSESLTVGSGQLVFELPSAAVESTGLEGELNLLGAAFRLVSEAPSAWVGCVGGGIGLLEGKAWLGAEGGAGALMVGPGLDGFRGGFLTEDQGPGLD